MTTIIIKAPKPSSGSFPLNLSLEDFHHAGKFNDHLGGCHRRRGFQPRFSGFFECRGEKRGWKPRLLYHLVPIESEAHGFSLTHKFNWNGLLEPFRVLEAGG